MTVDPTEHATISIEDRTVEGPHGALRVRVYRPTTTAAAGLVWAHGGAFAFGDLEMPEADGVARRLAGQGISVVSVDYQLAPPPGPVAGTGARDGARFPVASEEVTAAFAWASTHTAALGVPGGAWSLGGASAGGNLAAGAALRLRDTGGPQPESVVLAYPLLHASLPPLREELAQKIAALPPEARFDSAAVGTINLNYVQDPADLSSPYAFPGGHDLHGLPPTFVLTCEYDGLRASGEAYASELAAVGVDLLLVREDGTRHGHLNDPDHPAAARSLCRVAAWLTGPTRAGLPPRGPAAARQHRVQ